MKNLTAAILIALPALMISPTVMAGSSDLVAKTVDVQFKKGANSANYYVWEIKGC